MDDMEDAAIERDLVEAQAAVISARETQRRRQEAVVRAREAGWSKYRIAAALGLQAGTVTAILVAARKAAREEAARRDNVTMHRDSPESVGQAIETDEEN